MAELELCLGSEKIPVACRRIIGGCDPDGLKNLFQPLLRLSDPREEISDLALRRKEAWVEFEAALQRTYARVVLTAVLLQQRFGAVGVRVVATHAGGCHDDRGGQPDAAVENGARNLGHARMRILPQA